jgi:hypothetical protein
MVAVILAMLMLVLCDKGLLYRPVLVRVRVCTCVPAQGSLVCIIVCMECATLMLPMGFGDGDNVTTLG